VRPSEFSKKSEHLKLTSKNTIKNLKLTSKNTIKNLKLTFQHKTLPSPRNPAHIHAKPNFLREDEKRGESKGGEKKKMEV
jgi:hypothetical protein